MVIFNNRKWVIYCLGALSFATYQAQAEDGIYLWAEGGWAEQSGIPSASSVNATKVEQPVTFNSYRGSVGYNHDFTPVFGLGIEVGKASYGKSIYHFSNSEDMQITLSTLEFLGVLNLHLQYFDLFTKLGGQRTTPSISGTNALSADTVINPEVAVGAAYNLHNERYPFVRHFAISLSYIKVIHASHLTDLKTTTDEKDGTSTSSDGILLGLRYTFGPSR